MRMFTLLMLAFLAFPCATRLYAQEDGTKGIRPVSSSPARSGGAVRAVIIGISDYQDSSIPDLHFADKDAQAFAQYLRLPTVGSLPADHLQVLTNEKATMGSIQSALEWLLRNTKKGDQAILYFSGHGDVETKHEQEKGYLLAYDTPKNNYRTNAIDIQYLNEHIIGGLSGLGATVIAIMDACHSGSLAGEGIGGKEVTAMELMKRFGSEVRIMSCQPYELSLEGLKWGGGRGLFSYYFIDGLKGRADEDGDHRVDLYELEGFLQRRVREDADKKQHPDIFGGRKEEALFSMDEAMLAEVRARSQGDVQQDFESDVLHKLASQEGYANYLKFNEAVAEGRLLGLDGSAAAFYKALYADPVFIPLRGIIDERLVTALVDSAQQAIIAYLNTDPLELAHRANFDQKYARFPAYLRQAADILGPQDSRYKQTLAKQYYFEGLVFRMAGEQHGGNDSLYHLALEKQRMALEQEDRAAYIHNETGLLLLELGDSDQGIASLQRAIALSPTWAIPYNNLATEMRRKDSLSQAEGYYQKAIALKPDLASAYTNLGNLLGERGQPDSAEIMYREAIKLNPANENNYFYLGLLLSELDGRRPEAEALYQQVLQREPHYPEVYLELGNLYEALGQPEKAEAHYRKALAQHPHFANAYLNLGVHYCKENRLEEAEKMLLEAIHFDSTLVLAYRRLAILYQHEAEKIALLLQEAPLDVGVKMKILRATGQGLIRASAYDDALKVFHLASDFDPADAKTYYWLCAAYALNGQERKALDNLEKALQYARTTDENYFDLIRNDDNLKSLRTSKRYAQMMKHYFPDKQ